jgi:hypothetical protein
VDTDKLETVLAERVDGEVRFDAGSRGGYAHDGSFASNNFQLAVDELATGRGNGNRQVEVVLHLHGKGSVNDLAARLSELPSVRAVTSDDANVLIDD